MGRLAQLVIWGLSRVCSTCNCVLTALKPGTGYNAACTSCMHRVTTPIAIWDADQGGHTSNKEPHTDMKQTYAMRICGSV